MLMLCLNQKLWVIQFYQILYGNWWQFDMSVSEIVNISRMIKGGSISKNLSERNMLKLQSLVYMAFTVFELIRIFQAAWPPGLMGLKYSFAWWVKKGEERFTRIS